MLMTPVLLKSFPTPMGAPGAVAGLVIFSIEPASE